MNKNINDNMSDNEIRILGSNTEPILELDKDNKKWHHSHRKLIWWSSTILLFAIIIIVGICVHSRSDAPPPSEIPDNHFTADTLSVITRKDSVKVGPSYTNVSDTTINDIPLRIFTPVGGRMELVVDHHPEKDKRVILAAHAADLRGDDGTPAGAFVYNGNILSKGQSKYGFCAIVDSTVSIGRQIETSLFERAIEQNGCFFRQYSIVSNGKLIPIPPKGKSQRRALCLKGNAFMIIESTTSESYHDFSQALKDFGVAEALALVGSNAAVMWREESGQLQQNGGVFGDSYPLENYIVWKK